MNEGGVRSWFLEDGSGTLTEKATGLHQITERYDLGPLVQITENSWTPRRGQEVNKKRVMRELKFVSIRGGRGDWYKRGTVEVDKNS